MLGQGDYGALMDALDRRVRRHRPADARREVRVASGTSKTASRRRCPSSGSGATRAASAHDAVVAARARRRPCARPGVAARATRSSSPTASRASARSSTSSSSTRRASAAGSRACSGPTTPASPRTRASSRRVADVAQPSRSTARASRPPRSAWSRRPGPSASILAVVLRAVVFDVDFTLARPGPDLGPDGYRQLGLRYGLDLDPTRYEQARAAAFAEVKRHPELDHDEEMWVLFTERDHRRHGRHRRHVRRCGRDGAAVVALGALRALRRRAARARHAARAAA